MIASPNGSSDRGIARARRAYRRLLRVLPSAFRAAHGEEVVMDFERLVRSAHARSGMAGVWKTWLRASADVALRAPGEQWRALRSGTRGSYSLAPHTPAWRSDADGPRGRGSVGGVGKTRITTKDARVRREGGGHMGAASGGSDGNGGVGSNGGNGFSGGSGGHGPDRGAGNGASLWPSLVTEFRQAARALRRRPGYSAVAALTLGLGIGANVAIFTVVNRVLLRPLPFPESERLVTVRHHAPGLNLPELENSPGLIEFYREEADAITALATVELREVNLSGVGQPARIQALWTGVELFDVMGTRPMLGRPFVEADVVQGAAPVAILMYDAWRTRFGGEADVVGERVEIDGRSTEIVGVMPAGFEYPDPETVALVARYVDPALGFGTFGFPVVARLAPGVDLDQARTQFEALQARLPERFTDLPADFFEQAGWAVSVDRLRDRMIEDIQRALWVLLGTVGIVLLIACANVANLFLVRAESRSREIAVRTALGASRARVALTMMSETVLLGTAGGVGGVLLATVGLRALVARGPSQLPRLHEVSIDGASIGLAALLGIAAGLLLGMLPTVRSLAGSIATSLREGGRGGTVGRARHRLRKTLIAGQVALALVLLVGSGLMLRSVMKMYRTDVGLETDGVLTVGVSYGSGDPGAVAQGRDRARVFYDQLLEQVAAIPGIRSVGMTNALPLNPTGMNGGSFAIESQPQEEGDLPPVAMWSVISPGFFETLRIPLLGGRAPTRSDHLGGAPVAWVNQTFQRDFLKGDALGERLRLGTDSTWFEVVGLVGDVRTFGVREDARPTIYLPMSNQVGAAGMGLMQFVVRSDGDAAAVLPPIRAAVGQLDPDVPLTTARTMDEIVARSLADTSFTMALLGIAAAVALLLGAIGLYGVISYVVSQRTQEIGVRLALGARPADVRSMVVRQGLAVTTVGVVIGMLGAVAATRLLASLLFEVSARDPVTFVGVAALLVAVSTLAAWLPARRAASIDPVSALREE